MRQIFGVFLGFFRFYEFSKKSKKKHKSRNLLQKKYMANGAGFSIKSILVRNLYAFFLCFFKKKDRGNMTVFQ